MRVTQPARKGISWGFAFCHWASFNDDWVETERNLPLCLCGNKKSDPIPEFSPAGIAYTLHLFQHPLSFVFSCSNQMRLPPAISMVIKKRLLPPIEGRLTVSGAAVIK